MTDTDYQTAESEEVWGELLTKWQTDPDIQESERGLYAMPWAADALLLRQTLDISAKGSRLQSRSPGNSLAAMLRSMGKNPGSAGVAGADVAWQWVQSKYAKDNATM